MSKEIIVDPGQIAANLIAEHQIQPNYDATSESHQQVSQLIASAVGELSCGQLGELICTDQDNADAREFAGDLEVPQGTNFRGLLEHTATYIVDMVMHQQLNPRFPHDR